MSGTHDDLVTALGLATLADKPAASWADIGTGPLAAYLAGI